MFFKTDVVLQRIKRREDSETDPAAWWPSPQPSQRPRRPPGPLSKGACFPLPKAYSCLHYRSLFDATETPKSPPMDVVIEVLTGFFMCLIGIFGSVGPFVEIKTTAANKVVLVSPPHRGRDFDIYSTRGKVLEDAKRNDKS